MTENSEKRITSLLVETGCLKFGDFKLKSGASSSYYIDLRESTLYPELFKLIVDTIENVIKLEKGVCSDIAIVGVPYGVVPIAAMVAYKLGVSYYPVRKETKSYGHKGDNDLLNDYKYILIEDVMSSGSSIIETIGKLQGKNITDVIVVVNREAGGIENIAATYPNINVHSILKATKLLETNQVQN